MTDIAYENAVKRQAELKKELAEVEDFLRLYQRFSGGTEGGQNALTKSVEPNDSATVSPPPTKRGLTKRQLRKNAREIILENGRPMTRGQLVEALEARGLPVGGANPSKNMGTMMWRLRDYFVNLEGFGYWPIDKDCSVAGYTGKPAEQSSLLS